MCVPCTRLRPFDYDGRAFGALPRARSEDRAEMTETPPTNGKLMLVRVVAAGVALATSAAVLFAVFAIAIAKARGLTLVDVLTAPIAFVVYGGPPLLAAGLAIRARNAAATAIATVLVAALAGGLVALGGAPWEFASWQASAADAQTKLLLGTLFGAWPATLLGSALWRPANRDED
jgi:hypothetical protein